MDINYELNVSFMECFPTASGQNDVVYLVHWVMTASTGSYIAQRNGMQPVNYSEGYPFIPYPELTKTQVVQWLEQGMSPESYQSVKDSLATNIENQINPPTVCLQPPW